MRLKLIEAVYLLSPLFLLMLTSHVLMRESQLQNVQLKYETQRALNADYVRKLNANAL